MDARIETAMKDMTGLPLLLWDGTYPSKLQCPVCLFDLDVTHEPGWCPICRALTAIIIVREPAEIDLLRLLGPMLRPPWDSLAMARVRQWIRRIQLSDEYQEDVDLRISDIFGSLEMCTNALRYGRMDQASLDLANRCDDLKHDINCYLLDRLSTTRPIPNVEDA